MDSFGFFGAIYLSSAFFGQQCSLTSLGAGGYGIWSKCLLPKMAESRVHMGARYIFFTVGTHTHTHTGQ